MKLQNILHEATEKVDQNKRQKAKEILDSIYQDLFTSSFGDLMNHFRITSKAYVFELTYKNIDIDFHAFFQGTLGEGGISYDENEDVVNIVVYGFEGTGSVTDLNKEDIMEHILNQIYDYWNQIRIPIFHELIHLIDFGRINISSKELEDVNPYEKGWDVYSNDDLEFNSHYQEAIQDFEFDMENKPFSISELLNAQGFEWFRDHILYKRYKREVLENLSEKNLQKIKKRLWNYYQENL